MKVRTPERYNLLGLIAALSVLVLPKASAQCGWRCNSGDTLSGSTCIDIYAATISTQWDCPSGWNGPTGGNDCWQDKCSGTFGKNSNGAWNCFTSSLIGKARYGWCSNLGRNCWSCIPPLGPGGFWCDVNGALTTFNCYRLAGTAVSCGGSWSSGGRCTIGATSQRVYSCPKGGSHVSGTNNCRRTYQATGITCSSTRTPSSRPTPSNTAAPTHSPSNTGSYTRTATQTASATVSRSQSGSISVSRSLTSTATSTVSISMSWTSSPTHTASGTVSRSFSATVSRSQSASISFTRTATLSPGLSASMTSSLTATASTTATSSSTKSISISRTQTRTGSTTASISLSRSVSASSTSTPTSSITLGVSISRSQSFTPTYSSTGTGTVSISKSPSGTRTWSPTQTITGTRSASVTPSTSFSSSRTETPTTTASISETASSSQTALSTPSRTATKTPALPSLSSTASPTIGVSASTTGSVSVSFSGSQSVTGTRTVTRTGTRSATATRSRTVSRSFSASGSETASQSETSTVTASLTESPSESYSGSDTASITGSSTWSPSHTVTASVLPSTSSSSTASVTVGASISRTPSFTPTQSGTGTGTLTRTRTASTTGTRSATGTASTTPSVSFSETASNSVGASPPAPSRTASPSETASETASTTESASVSESLSGTSSSSETASFTPSFSITGSRPPATMSRSPSASVGAVNPRPAIINGLGSDDDPQAAGNAQAGGGGGGDAGGGGDGGTTDDGSSPGKIGGMNWWLLLIILLAVLIFALCCFLLVLLYNRRKHRERMARKKLALAMAAKTGPSTLSQKQRSKLRINLLADDGVGGPQVSAAAPTRSGRVSRMWLEDQHRDANGNPIIKGLLKNKAPKGTKVSSLLKGGGVEMNEMVAQRLMQPADIASAGEYGAPQQAGSSGPAVVRLRDMDGGGGSGGDGRRGGRGVRGSMRAEFDPVGRATHNGRGGGAHYGDDDGEGDGSDGRSPTGRRRVYLEEDDDEADGHPSGRHGHGDDDQDGGRSNFGPTGRSRAMGTNKSRVDFAPKHSAVPGGHTGEGVEDEDDLQGSGKRSNGKRSNSNRKRLQLDGDSNDGDGFSGPSSALSRSTNNRASTRFGVGPMGGRGRGGQGLRGVTEGSHEDDDRSLEIGEDDGDSQGQYDRASRTRSGTVPPGGLSKRVSSLNSRMRSGSVEVHAGSGMNGSRAKTVRASQFGFANPLSASDMDASGLSAAAASGMASLSRSSTATRSNIASIFSFIGNPGAKAGLNGTHVETGSPDGAGSPGMHAILSPSDYRELASMRPEDASNPRYGRGQHRDSVGASLGLEDEAAMEALPPSALISEGHNGGARASSSVLRALGLGGSSSGPASARPSTSALAGSGSVQSQIYSRGSAVSVSSRMRPSLFRVSNPIAAARASTASARDLGMSVETGGSGDASGDLSRMSSMGRMLSGLGLLGASSRGGGLSIPEDGTLDEAPGEDSSAATGSPSSLRSRSRRGSDVGSGGPLSANAARTLSSSMRDDAGRLALGVQRPRGYRTASSMQALAQQLGASPSARSMVRNTLAMASAGAPAPSSPLATPSDSRKGSKDDGAP